MTTLHDLIQMTDNGFKHEAFELASEAQVNQLVKLGEWHSSDKLTWLDVQQNMLHLSSYVADSLSPVWGNLDSDVLSLLDTF